MKLRHLQFMIMAFFLFSASMVFARDYIIYSIAQDVPMGYENEDIKKNYYVNMGSKQGLEQGSVLDVYRVISRLDTYETKQRFNHKVKIGELKVLHSEEDSSIAHVENVSGLDTDTFFDVRALMIGDHVDVKVE